MLRLREGRLLLISLPRQPDLIEVWLPQCLCGGEATLRGRAEQAQEQTLEVAIRHCPDRSQHHLEAQ